MNSCNELEIVPKGFQAFRKVENNLECLGISNFLDFRKHLQLFQKGFTHMKMLKTFQNVPNFLNFLVFSKHSELFSTF